MRYTGCNAAILLTCLAVGNPARSAFGQSTTETVAVQDALVALHGTIASSSKNSLTVRLDSGAYIVFIYDRFTHKTATLTAGTKVTVVSEPTGERGVRLATDILPYTPPGADQPTPPAQPAAQPQETAQPRTGSAQRAAHPYESGAAVPVSVRKLEGSIERQSRKFSAGFRAGLGLDPEVMLIGVQARMGPFFNRNFSFRPNLDFGFGEVTKMFALDLNGVFRLPVNPRHSKWSVFAGLGPNFSFIHRNFEEAEAGDIDFGDFDYKTGLNILTGVEFRNGFFVEAKSTVWAGPHLRLMVGYSF